MRRALVVLSLVAVAACGGGAAPPPATGPRLASTPTSPASTAAAPAMQSPQAGTATTPAPIVFIENDYDRAIADAKAKKLPLFIDVWAPWCHTCLSMRAYVFPDEKMKARAASFVWLAIDSENDVNAAFLAKHSAEALPTLWVVDPESEKPIMKWLGSATADEVASLLDDAVASLRGGGGEGGAALVALTRGNELSAQAKRVEAVREYRTALAAAPAGWGRRAEAVDALTERLLELKEWGDCVDTALGEAPALPLGTAVSDIVQTALNAAEHVPPSDARTAKVKTLTALGRKLVEDPQVPILPDDRSSLFERVVDSLGETDKPAALVVAREWATYLEAQAASATTPAGRVVFDSHRVAAYMILGEPQRALSMLEQSAKDFPDDYNPPARMVAPLAALKRYPEALAAADRALAHVYGPRTLRVLSSKADVYAAMGDKANEKKTLQAALEASRTMYGADHAREAIEKRLSEL